MCLALAGSQRPIQLLAYFPLIRTGGEKKEEWEQDEEGEIWDITVTVAGKTDLTWNNLLNLLPIKINI